MNSRAVPGKFFQRRAAAAMNTPALSREVFPAALEFRYERPRGCSEKVLRTRQIRAIIKPPFNRSR